MVTSSVPDVKWERTSVINSDLLNVLVELKQRSGGDIGIHGSIALTQSLLLNEMVDELRLVIAPTLQGLGRRLFSEGTPKKLVLLRSVNSPSGSLLLDYQVGK